MTVLKFDSVVRWFRTHKHVEIPTGTVWVAGYIQSIAHEGGKDIYILWVNTAQGAKEICVKLI